MLGIASSRNVSQSMTESVSTSIARYRKTRCWNAFNSRVSDDGGRASNINAAIKNVVDREYIVSCQSCISISRRIRSRTSRRPPPSFLTRRGLDNTPSKSSLFALLEPGLEGTSLSLDGYAEAGISSHSCPSMSRGLRKNGHKRVNIARDSWASALDTGTGDDFRTAAATSEAGSARRLRAESPTFVVDGPEKSLNCTIRGDDLIKDKNLHPDALSDAL